MHLAESERRLIRLLNWTSIFFIRSYSMLLESFGYIKLIIPHFRRTILKLNVNFDGNASLGSFLFHILFFVIKFRLNALGLLLN